MDTQTKDFLRSLHDGGSAAYWWCHHATTGFLLDAYPEPPQEDAYFCVNPVDRVMAVTERGGEASVQRINALHADFDGKDFVVIDDTVDLTQLEADLRQTAKRPNEKVIRRMAEARYRQFMFGMLRQDYLKQLAGRLAEIPQPSYVVFSGGGAHVYWLLEKPLVLKTDEDRINARGILRAWTQFVGADLGAATLDRVLRVPGTLNTKYDPPLRVQFRTYAPEICYSNQEIAGMIVPFLRQEAEQAAQRKTAVRRSNGGYIVQPGMNVGDIIREYDRTHSPVSILVDNGYQLVRDGRRMIRPGGTRDSISVFTRDDGTVLTYHHSTDDLLAAAFYDDRPHGAFSVLCELEFGGNRAAALRSILPEAPVAAENDSALLNTFLASLASYTPEIQSSARRPFTTTSAEVFAP